MAGEDTGAATLEEAATADKPQAGVQKNGATDDTPDGQEPPTFPAEYVKKLRSESASYRTRMSNAEKELNALKEGMLSEAEKLQKQLADIQKERDDLRTQVFQSQVVAVAAKHGAKYPDAVAKLIPVDTDDAEAAVKALRKEYPDMFRATNPDGGAGGGSGLPANDMNAAIRSAAGYR